MRTSRSQYQLLVNFMKRNADIVKYETDLSSKKWGELTRKLNADMTGEWKTVGAWKKVWMELKTQAKRKSSRRGVIGGSQFRPPLTELEQDVLSLLQPPEAAGISAPTNIKLEVPKVQTASPAEELISSNCCRFPLTVQPYQGSTQQTQNSEVQSRLQNSPLTQQQIKTEFPISPIAREMQIVPVQPQPKTSEHIRKNSPVPQQQIQTEFPISPIAREMQIVPVQPQPKTRDHIKKNSPVSKQQIKTEFPISPIAREMQIVPVQPQPKTREHIRSSSSRRCTASRKHRWCPYKRQGPPALMSAPVFYEDQHYATEYLRLWNWQLWQNERFLEIYSNNY